MDSPQLCPSLVLAGCSPGKGQVLASAQPAVQGPGKATSRSEKLQVRKQFTYRPPEERAGHDGGPRRTGFPDSSTLWINEISGWRSQTGRCHLRKSQEVRGRTRAEPTRPSGKHVQGICAGARCVKALHMEIRCLRLHCRAKTSYRQTNPDRERIPLTRGRCSDEDVSRKSRPRH